MSVKVVATLIMASLTIANKTPSLSDDKRAEIRFTENYYEEIGCTKIPNSDPIAYNCPDFKLLDPNKCYFNGKLYEDSEEVSNDDSPRCAGGCLCKKYENEAANFICPIVDCFFRPRDGCDLKYSSLDACCSSEDTCCNTGACNLDGKSYRIGQIIYPESEPCHHCLCSENFDNSTEITKNHSCQKIQCAPLLRYFGEIRQGCIPTHTENGCCPIGNWKCPTGNDTIIASGSSSNQCAPKCKFGDLAMTVGDQLETNENENLVCQCIVPPVPTCIMKNRT